MWINGKRRGVMVTSGLVGPLRWAVDLIQASVCIDGPKPPPFEPEPLEWDPAAGLRALLEGLGLALLIGLPLVLGFDQSAFNALSKQGALPPLARSLAMARVSLGGTVLLGCLAFTFWLRLYYRRPVLRVNLRRGESPLEAAATAPLAFVRGLALAFLIEVGLRFPPLGALALPLFPLLIAGLVDAGLSGWSPLYLRDALAELLFGEAEVLVAARDLVNDGTVRRIEGGEVTYVHLLFDRHQLIWSERLLTESFLPGPQTARSFEAEMVAEIRALFPEIDPRTGAGYSPAARRALRPFEARLLAGRAA